MIFVNLACGESFVSRHDWVNLDYSSNHTSVIRANLLGNLPLRNNSARAVYSSHFIEHIPRAKVLSFLKECYRVLEAQGLIRLVLPDWENLCREYLSCRDQGEHSRGDFLMLEMLDQCVRLYPGGLLGDYFDYLKSHAHEQPEMLEYIKLRCGEDLNLTADLYSLVANFTDSEAPSSQSSASRIVNLMTHPDRLMSRLQRKFSTYRIKLATALLPKPFREQNVSYASIGERHAWMWDFYALSQELERAGFHHIKRLSCDTTEIPDFPLIPLDMTVEGYPRKGQGSMYIEARK
ncbi:MAG: methyltransferase domain-containing protein [Cyanobacteria bacterium]|nr:methyltransferase domain-containing protein [Cyanobacteriota bacterium]